DFALTGELSDDQGYFRFGQDAICYGSTVAGFRRPTVESALYDVLDDVVVDGAPQVPFHPGQAIDNLRRERYLGNAAVTIRGTGFARALRETYYFIRPALPVPVRKHLQRLAFRTRDKAPFPGWPVDRSVESIMEQLLALLLKTHAV